jgi:hypothetical protein
LIRFGEQTGSLIPGIGEEKKIRFFSLAVYYTMAPAFILFCQPRDPIIEKSAHLNPAAIITSDFPAYVRDIPSIFEQDSNIVHTGTVAVNKFIAVHSPPPPKARARLAAIKTKVERKVEEPVKQEPVKEEHVEAVIKEEPVKPVIKQEHVIDKIVAIPTSTVEKPVEEKPAVEKKKPARKTVKRTVKKKSTDPPAK